MFTPATSSLKWTGLVSLRLSTWDWGPEVSATKEGGLRRVSLRKEEVFLLMKTSTG